MRDGKWVLRALWRLDVEDRQKFNFLRDAVMSEETVVLDIGHPQSVHPESDEFLIPVFAGENFHELVMRGHAREFGDTRFRGLKLDSMAGVVMGYLSSETVECEHHDEDGFLDFVRARFNSTDLLQARLESRSDGFLLRIYCDLPHKTTPSLV